MLILSSVGANIILASKSQNRQKTDPPRKQAGICLLYTSEEKNRVCGLISNKFRGDKTILDPGIQMLEERGGVPVTGVVPDVYKRQDRSSRFAILHLSMMM